MPKFRTLCEFMKGWLGNKGNLIGSWWEQWEVNENKRNLMRT